MRQVESLVINTDSKLHADGGVVLHVENKGSATAEIYKVEILSAGTADINSAKTMSPGAEATIEATVQNAQLVAGTTYVVRVYTKACNVYPITLRAEA
jgi:NCAIR mutase (PurE)-related protein